MWIGITQPRWYCVIASPFVALSLCLAFAAERASISVATTLMTVGISVVLGELIGWVKHAETVRSQELGLVIDGTSDLRSETDRIAAAQRLVMTVRDLVRVPNVAVYLPEDDGALRLAAKAGGIPWDTIRTSGSKTGELVLSAVTAGNELAIPLIGRAGQLRGVAVATGRRRPDEFMMRLAQILGEQAGYQFDDLAQLHALADENRRDALTGVGNRRYADEVLASLQPGDVVAVVDLDDLRGINARLGHHGGDESIRAIARHLVAAVRTDDAVARLGGDEFLILLRRADTDVGLLIERIAAEWNDEHPDASFSIGAIVHGGGDPEATLRSADNALFRAKHDGRARAHVEVRDELRQPDAAGF
ncbi:MAG: diguanylate cyclase domain-containing protein [Acidimicrobiia bacterium]